MSREAVIVDAIRTPIGKRAGALVGMHPVDLLTPVLQQLIQNTGIDPADIDDVITGCVTMTGEQGGNIGRLAALGAGLPAEVPAVSLNRMCGSSQQALHFGAQAILAGDMDVVIACGVESMTRVPMGSDLGRFSTQVTGKYNIVPQGFSAEMIAEKWKQSRSELTSSRSQATTRQRRRQTPGNSNGEILPMEHVKGEGEVFTQDEGIRRDTSLEKLAGLRPSFRSDGVVTAGNASQISDGAAGLLLMSGREGGHNSDDAPRARRGRAVVGVDPVIMLTSVIPTTRKVLQKQDCRWTKWTSSTLTGLRIRDARLATGVVPGHDSREPARRLHRARSPAGCERCPITTCRSCASASEWPMPPSRVPVGKTQK